MRYYEDRMKRYRAYIFTINPKHINALKDLIKFVADNDGKWAVLWELLSLDHAQYNNFRLLGLLWLVAKVYQAYDWQFREWEEGDEEARSVWFPTEFWRQYIRWEAACYNKIATIANEKLPYDHIARQGARDLAELKTAAEIYANPNYERYNDMVYTGNPNNLTEKQYKELRKVEHPTIHIREEVEAAT